MHQHRYAQTAVLMVCIALSVFAARCTAQVPNRTLTIYPLGDSITFGYSRSTRIHRVPGGYRAPLYALLTKAGYTVNFVGSSRRNPSHTLIQAHDRQHDGWPGWRIDQIASHVKHWLAVGAFRQKGPAYPDFILLHIGTNDIAQHYDPRFPGKNESESQFMHDMESRMTHLTQMLFTLRPKAVLIVAEIIPMGRQPANRQSLLWNSQVRQFNLFLKNTLAPQCLRTGKRLILADQYAQFSTPAGRPVWKHLLPDRCHPDAIGYRRMARTWFRAIVRAIHK